MIRWRTFFMHLLVSAPVVAGLSLFYTSQSPIVTTSAVAASVMAALILAALATLWTERKLRPVRQLTRVAEAAVKDDSATLLFPSNDADMARLVRALRQILNRRQRLMKKRTRAQERLLTVLNYMADGVIILNKSGKVRLMNPSAEHLLDMPMADAHGRSFIRVVRDHRVAELWQRCLDRDKETSQTIEWEDDRFFRVVVTPFSKGTTRGYLIMLQDLTEVHHLQRVRQDFVSNVSHELRTPLASLKALAETLRDGALDDPPAAHRFLERMDLEVDALTQMVQELLELSRIESGQMPLEMKVMSPAHVVVPAVERLQAQAERARLDLHVDVPDELPLVYVDTERVRHVIMNLVHNAIKFTPAAGTITVSAGQSENDDSVTVSVADTGVGIAAEDVPRVFERFYKSDPSRSSGGTGLGLAIAKHIVQAHGGQIWVKSTEGRGSVFSFTLPPVPRAVSTDKSPATPEQESSVATMADSMFMGFYKEKDPNSIMEKLKPFVNGPIPGKAVSQIGDSISWNGHDVTRITRLLPNTTQILNVS